MNQEEIKQKIIEQQKIDQQLDLLMRQLLTDEAKTRVNNIKLVNKELYLTVAQSLLYLQKSGEINGKLGDFELKNLLERLSQKREIKIKRK